MKPDESMMKLWGGFGRNPQTKQEQFDLYMEWTRGKSASAIEKTVDFIVNNEDYFPTMSKLNETYKKYNKQFKDRSFSKCYFCDGTGLVPYLYSPDDNVSYYHTRYFSCKCSEGDMVKLKKYFNSFENPQFSVVPEGQSYTQFVEFKRTDLNRSKLEREQE